MTAIAQVASANGWPLIDTRSVVQQSDLRDGLHLMNEGYAKLNNDREADLDSFINLCTGNQPSTTVPADVT
jgi:hypothetical protein